jgi:tetratricopeptide (TPR) repeat protein
MAAALTLVKRGEKLARTGYVEGAVGQFQKALEWNPNLDFDPEAKAAAIAQAIARAIALVEKGEKLFREGKVTEAIATYTEAQQLDPTLEISADAWNNLCWFGSLHGYAADVMNACEKAVALKPENGSIRDSRGLARALTGDMAGVLEDFQAFIDSTSSSDEEKSQRQRWIDVLRAGENPFTEEEIKSLLGDCSSRE